MRWEDVPALPAQGLRLVTRASLETAGLLGVKEQMAACGSWSLSL